MHRCVDLLVYLEASAATREPQDVLGVLKRVDVI